MIAEQERTIINRVLNGEVNAYEALVSDNQKKVYNLVLYMTGNREDAEDLTQEVFLKAYKSLASYRGDCRFSTWLHTIAVNTATDFIRARKETISFSDEDSDEIRDIPDESMSPERAAEWFFTREALKAAILELPLGMRQVLLLREVNSMSYDEIALAMNIDVGTVKSRMFRARKKLFAKLLKTGNIPDYFASNDYEGGEN